MKTVWIAMLQVMQVENLVGREIRNGAFTNGVAVANDGQDALAMMEVALRNGLPDDGQ